MILLKKLALRNWPLISVVAISFFYTIFILFQLVMMAIQKPPNTVNLMVGHYFEDYYEYLSFIKQGQQGHLFLQNLFTNDDPGNLFISWWLYSLMGFISYITHIKIPVWIIYWLWEFLFTFIFFILTFFAVSQILKNKSQFLKICAFIITVFASPLFKISLEKEPHIVPFDYWYSIGMPFSRFSSGTPHQQIIQVFFLLGILIAIKTLSKNSLWKNFFVFLIFSLLLLITSPPQLLVYWFAILGTIILGIIPKIKNAITTKGNLTRLFLLELIRIVPLLIVCVICSILALFLNELSLSSSTMISSRLWELNNLYYPPITLFILSTGLLFFLAALGLPIYFSNWQPIRIAFFLIFLLGSVMTLFPIKIFGASLASLVGVHNLRFFNPNAYIFLGTSSFLLIEKLAKKPLRIFITVSLILFIFFISLGKVWLDRLSVKTIYSQIGQLQYMTKDLYLGLSTLEDFKNQSVVLTSPSSNLGLVIPALTGRKVYYGRSIFTLNIDTKRKKADDFYNLKMNAQEAKVFLDKEKIDTVVLTRSDSNKKQLMDFYGFLKEKLNNNEVLLLVNKY